MAGGRKMNIKDIQAMQKGAGRPTPGAMQKK
jgi:hypothetical protein